MDSLKGIGGSCQDASALYQVCLNALGIPMKVVILKHQFLSAFDTNNIRGFNEDMPPFPPHIIYWPHNFDVHQVASFNIGGFDYVWDPTIEFESLPKYALRMIRHNYILKLVESNDARQMIYLKERMCDKVE